MQKVDFDIAAARKDGVTDNEIRDFFKENYKVDFDVASAKKDGISDDEIVGYLNDELKKKEPSEATGENLPDVSKLPEQSSQEESELHRNPKQPIEQSQLELPQKKTGEQPTLDPNALPNQQLNPENNIDFSLGLKQYINQSKQPLSVKDFASTYGVNTNETGIENPDKVLSPTEQDDLIKKISFERNIKGSIATGQTSLEKAASGIILRNTPTIEEKTQALGVGTGIGISQYLLRPLAGAMKFLSNSYLNDLTKSDNEPFPGTKNKGIFDYAAEHLNNEADNLEGRMQEVGKTLPDNLSNTVLKYVGNLSIFVGSSWITPEAKIGAIGKITGGIIKGIPKMAIQMGTEAAATQYNELDNADEKTKDIESLKALGIQGTYGLALGEMGFISKQTGKLVKGLTNSDLLSTIATTATNSSLFVGSGIAKNIIEGQPINTNEALSLGLMGWMFGLSEAGQGLKEFKNANEAINKKAINAWKNVATMDVDDIKLANSIKIPVDKLRENQIELNRQAETEQDPVVKMGKKMASNTIDRVIDAKAIIPKILENPSEVIRGIDADPDLSEIEKKYYKDKVNKIVAATDPRFQANKPLVEINQLDEKIKGFGEPKDIESQAILDNAVERRKDLYNQVKENLKKPLNEFKPKEYTPEDIAKTQRSGSKLTLLDKDGNTIGEHVYDTENDAIKAEQQIIKEKGGQNAETVRSNQGQTETTGQVGQTGQDNSGQNLQQQAQETSGNTEQQVNMTGDENEVSGNVPLEFRKDEVHNKMIEGNVIPKSEDGMIKPVFDENGKMKKNPLFIMPNENADIVGGEPKETHEDFLKRVGIDDPKDDVINSGVIRIADSGKGFEVGQKPTDGQSNKLADHLKTVQSNVIFDLHKGEETFRPEYIKGNNVDDFIKSINDWYDGKIKVDEEEVKKNEVDIKNYLQKPDIDNPLQFLPDLETSINEENGNTTGNTENVQSTAERETGQDNQENGTEKGAEEGVGGTSQEAGRGTGTTGTGQEEGGSGGQKPPTNTISDYFKSEQPEGDKGENNETKEIINTKKNYSNFDAFKDWLGYNLNQIKKYNPEINDKIVKYASSIAQTSTIIKRAANNIIKEVGNKGWEELRKALVESRLIGTRDRWGKMSEDIKTTSDEDLNNAFNNGLKDLLKNIEPKLGEKDIVQTGQKFITDDDYDGLKNYLSDVFKECQNNVASVSFEGGRNFDEIISDPKIQKAKQTYKDLIEKPIAENHAANEGIFSDALGPLDTYYPLVPLDSEGKRLGGKFKPFKKPLNISNTFATGLGENYLTSFESLHNKLNSAIRTNNLGDLIYSLETNGLLQKLGKGENPDYININGENFTNVIKDISEPTIVIRDGKKYRLPVGKVSMPEWLYKELKPVLEKEDYDPKSIIGKTFDKITTFSLGGPFEAAFHSANLIGGLTNATPYAGTGILSKTIGNLPVSKIFTAIINTAFEDLSSEQSIAHMQDMAKNGLVSPKAGTTTWNKKIAEEFGIKKVPFYNFSPVLYGMKGIDMKARVLMDRIVLNINPNATPQMRRDMGYQLGNYTLSLQGQLERTIKKNGISPFYTAGSTFYKNGLKSILGLNPLPTDNLSTTAKIGYKAAQLMTSGIVGMTAMWMTGYKAATGKWPWEDRDSKFMQIPIPENIKNTQIGKDLFYDKDKKKWNNVSMDFFNPVLARGEKAIGIPNMYKTQMAGGTKGQVIEAGEIQAINSALSPFVSSPPVKTISTALTGSSPYITSLRDDRGKPGIQMFRNVKTMPSGEQVPANLLQATININPLL